VIRTLLEAGHQWNVVDNDYKSAGEEALNAGHSEAYDIMLEWGIRIELILSLLEKKVRLCVLLHAVCTHTTKAQDEDEAMEDTEPSVVPYLSQKLHYSDDGTKLLDAEGRGVMMDWELPLMLKHAELLCPREGLDVLNVGFGLGLVDEAVCSGTLFIRF